MCTQEMWKHSTACRACAPSRPPTRFEVESCVLPVRQRHTGTTVRCRWAIAMGHVLMWACACLDTVKPQPMCSKDSRAESNHGCAGYGTRNGVCGTSSSLVVMYHIETPHTKETQPPPVALPLMTSAGLEPAIPGYVGRCLIHWATTP